MKCKRYFSLQKKGNWWIDKVSRTKNNCYSVFNVFLYWFTIYMLTVNFKILSQKFIISFWSLELFSGLEHETFKVMSVWVVLVQQFNHWSFMNVHTIGHFNLLTNWVVLSCPRYYRLFPWNAFLYQCGPVIILFHFQQSHSAVSRRPSVVLTCSFSLETLLGAH